MSGQNFWKEQVRTKQFIASVVLFVVVEIVLLSIDAPTGWHFMSVYTLFLCGSAQISTTPGHFFRGAITSKSQDGKSQALLTLSAFISWIFAKSIYNASVLGGKYGITGGWGYATAGRGRSPHRSAQWRSFWTRWRGWSRSTGPQASGELAS